MKNKSLIIVVASSLMLLAYFVLPYVASIKVSSFGMSQTEKVNLSLFEGLKETPSVLDFILMLLVLLAPLYLLVDVFREKLKKYVPVGREDDYSGKGGIATSINTHYSRTFV